MKMHFAPALRIAAVVAGTVLGSQSAFAGVSVTAEAPGIAHQASTQPNIVTETFNSASLGTFTSLVSSIGTYTATANSSIILAADQYGGANGTQYVSVGAQAGSSGSMTLTLNTPADYFGLWWSAVDPRNMLDFYSGGVNVGHFDSTNLPDLSNSAYNGNPNNGLNTGEKYAYLNFFGTAGTSFDTIVFTNTNQTGFESDNHSIHAVNAVPEPSALLMGGAASIIGLAVARRRGRKA